MVESEGELKRLLMKVKSESEVAQSCLTLCDPMNYSLPSSSIYGIFQAIYFCFIDYAKAFDYVDYNKLWRILKEMGIPDPLTCLLRNLYAGQEQQLELDMEQQTGSK